MREEFAAAQKQGEASDGPIGGATKSNSTVGPPKRARLDAAWQREGTEILSKLLAGKVMAQIHCVTADEIMTAAEVITAFKLKACLVHATYAYQVADQLSKRRIPVICGPLLFTDRDNVQKNPGKLAKAGIKVAFCTDAPFSRESYLRVSAAIAVRYGMDKSEALKALRRSMVAATARSTFGVRRMAAARRAAASPAIAPMMKHTVSALEPRRLAPWIPPHTSPAAYNPGIPV